MPLDALDLAFEKELADIQAGSKACNKQNLIKLIESGWRNTYAEFFGQSFVDVLDSVETDDKHQSEALNWHWASRIQLIKFELELQKSEKLFDAGVISFDKLSEIKQQLKEEFYPEFWAYLAMWARGNMKTTIARYLTIIDAVLSYAYDVKGYALIVGGTVAKIRGTAKTFTSLLQSPKIKHYAPELAEVKKSDQGTSQGWTAEFINTSAGYIFHFIGLDQGVAGANVDNVRPTLIIPDDIDDREDSAVISEDRFQILTRSVIPTKQWNTLFFVAQNVISRFSVIYRIFKQQVRVLANRFPTSPVPAVRDLVTEEQTVNGVIKDIVISGRCTWRGWDLTEVQNQIDTMTLPIFKMECQHEVDESKDGIMHKKYDDNVHPISWSQFNAVYGAEAWKSWIKVPVNDWARTKTKFHANVAGYLCTSSANTKLPGLTFLIPFAFPADTTPNDVAVCLLSALTPYAYGKTTWQDLIDQAWKRTNEQTHFRAESDRLDFLNNTIASIIPRYSQPILKRCNVKTGAMSHSEDKVRAIYNNGFGFSFIPSNPGETDGLDQIDLEMRVDYKLPHLFDQTKMGYTRWYVICADDLQATPKIVNGIKVYPPKPYPEVITPDNLFDDDLFRYQMKNRRFAPPKLSETGEKIDTPQKLNDDFGQCLQMVYHKLLLQNAPLSKEEKFAATIQRTKPHLTSESIDKAEGERKSQLLTELMLEQNEYEKKHPKHKVEKTDFYVADDDFSWMKNL